MPRKYRAGIGFLVSSPICLLPSFLLFPLFPFRLISPVPLVPYTLYTLLEGAGGRWIWLSAPPRWVAEGKATLWATTQRLADCLATLS